MLVRLTALSSSMYAGAVTLALLALFLPLMVGLQGCQPTVRCDDQQYYWSGTCRTCPDGSEWVARGPKDPSGTCKCIDEELKFNVLVDGLASHICSYADGGVPDMSFTLPVSDAGADAGEGGVSAPPVGDLCPEYCNYAVECVASNPLVGGAMGLANDVLEELLVADLDPTDCSALCAEEVSEDNPDDFLVLICLQGKRAAAQQSGECVNPMGLDAARVALDALDYCCLSGPDSAVCTRLCSTLRDATNAPLLLPLVEFCGPEEKQAMSMMDGAKP